MPRKLAAVAGATVLLSAAGWGIGQPWLLPILCAAPGYTALFLSLRSGRRTQAIGLMLWWAFCLGLTAVVLSATWNTRAHEVILNGPAYRDEMFAWITSGTGRESTPTAFIPQHLLHAGLFSALSLLTASGLSIIMGSGLMNYMSFYVGDLLHHCSGTATYPTAILLAWNPWSMVRVASFIILGVVLAEPLLSRLPGNWPPAAGRRFWLLLGGAGLLLDILLKTILAPWWPGLLEGCLG